MKKIIITGTNKGIGLELAKQCSARGDEVWALCRKTSPELNSLDGVKILQGIDIKDETVWKNLKQELPEKYFDLFIHNAGVYHKENTTHDLVENFHINAAAPLLMSLALETKLAKNAKLAYVSSRMGSIADNTSGGSYAYRMSKAALNAGIRALALDWKDKGHPIVILHPGYVRTSMTQNTGHIDAQESAEGLLRRIEELTLPNTGKFFHQNGEELPW